MNTLSVNFIENKMNKMSLKDDVSMYHYQKNIVNWMKDLRDTKICGSRGGVLFVEMGLGKTFTTLEYIRKTKKTSKINLVICSKSLIGEWLKQIDKFYIIKPKVYVLHSTYNNIKEVTKEKLLQYDIILTTYNMITKANKIDKNRSYSDRLITKTEEYGKMKWVIKDYHKEFNNVNNTIKCIYNINWNNIFCDECQIVTNWKTKIFQSIYGLNTDYIYGLSGTPIKNNRNEFISLLKFLKCRGHNYPSTWKKDSISEYGFCLFNDINYEKAKVTLPESNETVYELNLSNKTIKILSDYFDLWDYYLLRHKDGFGDSMGILMGLFVRFRQISLDPYLLIQNKNSMIQFMNATHKIEEIKENWEECNHGLTFGNEKYDAIKKILNEIINRNEKVVIFSSFSSYIELLIKKLEIDINIKSTYISSSDSIIERHSKINNWKNQEDKTILIMNYRIGAEGLNLVESNNVILLDTWWNFVYEKQAIARCLRIGQKKTVNIYRLIYKNSVETLMYNKSISKLDIFNKIKNNEEIEDDESKLSLENMTKIVNILKGLVKEDIRLNNIKGTIKNINSVE